MDFALPYMVQVVREYTTRVHDLEQKQDKMADKTEDLNQLAPTTGDGPGDTSSECVLTGMGGYDMGMGQMALMGPGMGQMGGVGTMMGGQQQQQGFGGGYGGY